MALSYLQIVNKVLTRLRESTVSSIASSEYATLIGEFVNDTRREIEKAFQWDANGVVLPVATVAGTAAYTVTGSGRYQRGVEINDTTNRCKLSPMPIQWIMDQMQLTGTPQTGNPAFYAWDGFNGTDSTIRLFPVPSGVFNLQLNMYVDNSNLSADTDIPTVDADLIILGAYARAEVERGEEGGLQSSEAYQLFRSALSDAIAIESNRFIENSCWEAV